MQSEPLEFEHIVEPLFQEALDLPQERRADFLSHRCGDNVRVRARVERLLQASTAAEDQRFWRGSALQAEANRVAEELDSSVPDRYRLLERIGAGGMGAVYKAVRADDEYSKLVALKIVQTNDPRMVERFRKERQILARLEHPGIARLLDGGSTRDGRPFLVMEYVEGVPLDRFVAAKKPSLREKLALFREICAAVAYAHSNLVVHRDLKPANILVTGAGEPKLLDFGIAKLLDDVDKTRTGLAAMTPDYASPEQVTGAPITTSSDIYSLGILLYEMLTGQRPYAAATTPMELTRAIATGAPRPMGPGFARDLEVIVHMALRKEPERRYVSAGQFADDVQRYVDGYPVHARPDTAAYRAAKFVVRNRVVVAGLAILFLTLIGGIAATEWEARAANERFADIRELAHSVVFDYHDAIENLPGATEVRERMVKDALRYLNKLSRSGGGDDLQREVAKSYIKISRVQGNDYSSNLGDVKGAAETADKAVAIAGKLVTRQPSIENRALLAEADKEQADVRYSAGDLEGAAISYRKAVELFDEVLPHAAPDLDLQDTAVNAYCHLGELLGGEGTTNLGRPEEAMEPYRKALPIAGLMAAQHPDSRIAQKAMYTVQLGIALLEYAAGRLDAAEQANRGALATITRIAQAYPDSMTDQVELTVARARLARVLSDNGKAAEAARMELTSIALIDAQAKLEPSNMLLVRNQSMSEWQAANALLRSGDARRALPHAERAVALAKNLRERNPNDAVVVADLGRRIALLVEVNTALHRTAAALQQGREALQVLGEDRETNQNADLRRVSTTVRLAIGEAAFTDDAPAAAMAEFGTAEKLALHELATEAGRFPARVDLARARAGKAAAEARLGMLKDALTDYQASLAVWQNLRAAGVLPPPFAAMPQHISNAIEKLSKT